jgi:hypothetical protein
LFISAEPTSKRAFSLRRVFPPAALFQDRSPTTKSPVSMARPSTGSYCGRVLAQSLELAVDGGVLDVRLARLRAQAVPVRQLDDRQRLEHRAERQRLVLVDLQVHDLRARQRLEPAPLDLLEHHLVDQLLGHVLEQVGLEALLDDVRRHLARAEAGQLQLLRVVLGAIRDLLVDDRCVDLEGERFSYRRFLGVLDFQGLLLG